MFLYACFCASLGFTPDTHAADLAVVIDDVGYSQYRGQRAIRLPGPLTIAVLPFTPHGQQLAIDGQALGQDIIIHQPMEPFPSAHAREEHGTLKLAMHSSEFDSVLHNALSHIPQRVGMSNHTGSLLTQHHEPMRRLMAQLAKLGLFFLDSRTSADTVAMQVALEMGVPAVRRDVFLDHDRSPTAIAAAFDQAVRIARYHGKAVLVGHPYPETLDFLETRLRHLPDDVRLVTASSLAEREKAIYAQKDMVAGFAE